MNLAQYIGIPYDIHSKNGLNCWSLVGKVFNDLFGDSLPEFKARSDDPRDIATTFTQAFTENKHGFKKVDAPSDFCVVVFKRSNIFGVHFHCGLFYKGKVLHSSSRFGSVCYQDIKTASIGFREVEFWQR